MRGSEFAELKAFTTVATKGSFVRAAEQLGLSASSISQVIRDLEDRLGVRLLNRTTRSVSLTDAGSRLLARLTPAFVELEASVQELGELRDKPSGRLRIVTPRLPFIDHLGPLLDRFHVEYPDVMLDITVDDAITDIAARGYDLGVRLGELLEQDVVAFKMGGKLRQIAVASPEYVVRHGKPKHPRDLHAHKCISWRQAGSITPYSWEFQKGKEVLAISVNGPLILNDRSLTLLPAVQGVGIAFWVEHRVRSFIEAGTLVPLLEDWSPSFPGFFAYYRKQTVMPTALRVFVDFLKASVPKAQASRSAHESKYERDGF
jgi:DNA-binding transcriptional LysR family regulator